MITETELCPHHRTNLDTGVRPQHRSISEAGLSEARFGKIMCPNMRTGVRMSLLNPDADGWVEIEELVSYLDYTGVPRNSKVSDLLIYTAIKAVETKREGYVNIAALHGTFLDHGSDSAILNTPSGFSEERLEYLLSFGKNDRLTKNDLSRAISAFYQNGVNGKSFLGSNVLSFEFAGMVEIYGRKDPKTGEKYFTKEDIVSLWKNNKFPEEWQAPESAFYGTIAAFMGYLGMMWLRVKTGWSTKGP